jgi:hypothetical protein
MYVEQKLRLEWKGAAAGKKKYLFGDVKSPLLDKHKAIGS